MTSSHHTARREGEIFVFGPPRSGSTLLRLMLNAHPAICAPDELIFFSDAVFPRGALKWAEADVPRAAIASFVSNLAKRLPGVVESEVWERIDKLADRRPRSVFECVMGMLCERAGKSRWADKTPGHLFFADALIEMYPHARFVMLHRDPRAIVASMNRASFCSSDTGVNALNLKHYLGWFRRAERLIPASSRVALRYEDLLANPETELKRICDRVDVPYDPAMLDFHAEARDHMQATAAQGFNRRATERLDPANAERWRLSFPAAEQRVVERVLGSSMLGYGYEPETSAVGAAVGGRLVEASKALYWRFDRLRYRWPRCFQQRDTPFFRTRMRLWRMLRAVGVRLRQPSHGRGTPGR